MHDHSGHTPKVPNGAQPNTPAKPNAANEKTPAKPDPHAGHDTGKSEKPGVPQKATEKK